MASPRPARAATLPPRRHHEQSDESTSHQDSLRSPLSFTVQLRCEMFRTKFGRVAQRAVRANDKQYPDFLIIRIFCSSSTAAQSCNHALAHVRSESACKIRGRRPPSFLATVPVFPEEHRMLVNSQRGHFLVYQSRSQVSCSRSSVPSVHAQAVYGSISGTIRDNTGAHSAGRHW